MKVVTKYECTDGSVFSCEMDALRHENSFLNTEYKNKVEELNALKAKLEPEYKRMMSGKDLPVERQKILDCIPETSGIYMWVNVKDGFKKYVGSAKNLRTRAVTFLNFETLYGGEKITEARKKFNSPSFWTYSVLELCSVEDLDDTESYYINALGTSINGYNSSRSSVVKRNHKFDKLNEGVPSDVLKRYNSFISGYAMGIGSEDKRRKWNANDFYIALQKLNVQPVSHKAVITFKIKAVRKGLTNSDDMYDMSIVPGAVSKMSGAIYSFDENGYPDTLISYTPNFGYEFRFTSKHCGDISTYGNGYATKKEAFKALLMLKTTILRKVCEENRTCIDDDAYEIISTLTLGEAELLFTKKKNVYVFHGTSEGNEFLPSV